MSVSEETVMGWGPEDLHPRLPGWDNLLVAGKAVEEGGPPPELDQAWIVYRAWWIETETNLPHFEK